MLSVVGDMFVNSETSLVTLSISRFTGPTTRFFGGTYRSRVCVLVFIGICERQFVTGSRKIKVH